MYHDFSFLLSYCSELISYMLYPILYLVRSCWKKLPISAFSCMSEYMNIIFIHIRHMFLFTALSSGFSVFQISSLNHAIPVASFTLQQGIYSSFSNPFPPPFPQTWYWRLFSPVFAKSICLCMSLHLFLTVWHLVLVSFSCYSVICTGCLQMNGAVSKVNKKFIAHLTRAKRTPSAAAAVQVSHALPAVRNKFLVNFWNCTIHL